MCLDVSGYYCQVFVFFFWKKMHLNVNQKEDEYKCNMFMRFKEKDKSTFLSLQP